MIDKNNFLCIDDEFSYSRCVYQCNECKEIEENEIKKTRDN